MADGAVYRPPYAGVQLLIEWAQTIYAYIDGQALLSGLDLRDLNADRFLNVLQTMWLNETMHEKEWIESRDSKRAALDQVYDQGYRSVEELYGRSNDTVGEPEFPPMNTPDTRATLPYIAAIEPTDEGYPGLDPPVG